MQSEKKRIYIFYPYLLKLLPFISGTLQYPASLQHQTDPGLYVPTQERELCQLPLCIPGSPIERTNGMNQFPSFKK
jgi:hypothetical protein